MAEYIEVQEVVKTEEEKEAKQNHVAGVNRWNPCFPTRRLLVSQVVAWGGRCVLFQLLGQVS